jgi:antitoxin ParD1/3/4
MPTRNVDLPENLDQFITAKVESGDYANASEVMQTAPRVFERHEQEYEEKMTALRAAIEEGEASGDAEDGVFERLDAYIAELAAGEEECRHIAEQDSQKQISSPSFAIR